MSRILIVEDDELTAKLIEADLEQMEHKVVAKVPNGEEAVTTADETKPDLVLMDILLEGEMDGIETADQIRSRFDIPVVYLTTHADKEILDRAKQTGPYGYLEKPTTLLELSGTIETALHKHEADKRLRESEERYRTLVETMNEGLGVLDVNGTLTYCNEAFSRTIGCSSEELIGQSALDCVHEDSKGTLTRELSKRSKGQSRAQYEVDLIGRDGRRVPVLVSAQGIYGRDGRYKGTFAVTADITERKEAEEALKNAHDELEQRVDERTVELRETNARLRKEITDRKNAEEALRKSEEKYRFLTEQMHDIVWTVGLDMKTTYVSPSIEKVLGFTPEERLDQTVSRQLTPESFELAKRSLLEEIELDTEDGARDKSLTLELDFFRKDGSIVCLESTLSFLRDEDLNLIGIYGLSRDITDRNDLEEQLRSSQKMEAVGTLAGGIAHDFNNLLQVVTGYTEILLSQKDSTNPDYEDLGIIFRAANQGAELVRSILAFSRKAEPNARPVNLNREIEQVHKMMYRTLPRMINIELHLADDLKIVNADPAQMEQVLLNFAVNSRDAMPGGGRFLIETQNVFLDDEYRRRNLEVKPGHYVRMTVSDTGCGMAPEVVERIFEPFYTTKKVGEGTGLGLSAAFGIVKSHDGHITCYSEPGVGTTFRIDIPVLEAEIASAVEEDGEAPPSGTETLLVVDDEELIRELAMRYLIQAGYKILMAGNGVEALEIYRENQSGISLVILDLIMPEMGGRECLKDLLEINPNVKVLIASGFSPDGPTKETLEAGAKGFVQKPFRAKGMLTTIRQVLDQD